MRDVFDGAIVAFQCQGDVTVADHSFLDAITDKQKVMLSKNFDPPFTGARWQCMQLADGDFALVSAGEVFGFRYLDGNTHNGFVQTVGDTLPPFSGTRWRIQELSPGVVTILCRGEFQNPKYRFLDGKTQTGEVGLVTNTDPPFSGTKWRTFGLPQPSLQVHTQRQQTGSWITIRGTNFTPHDGVSCVAEGIVGRTNHAPFALGATATADGSGSFETFAEVGFFPSHPADIDVIIRATDHHGRTANGFSNGFHA